MKYLFDTDHFSILQRRQGAEYARLSTWMASFTVLDFACCVVGLHEQLLGAHGFLNQAKNSQGLIRVMNFWGGCRAIIFLSRCCHSILPLRQSTISWSV